MPALIAVAAMLAAVFLALGVLVARHGAVHGLFFALGVANVFILIVQLWTAARSSDESNSH